MVVDREIVIVTALPVPVIPPPVPGWFPPGRLAPAGDRLPVAAGPDPGAGPPAWEGAPVFAGRPGAWSPPANPAAVAARSARAAVSLVGRRRGRGMISKSVPGPAGPSPGSPGVAPGSRPPPGAGAGSWPAMPLSVASGPDSRSSMDARGVGCSVIVGDHSCRRASMGGREAARLAG